MDTSHRNCFCSRVLRYFCGKSTIRKESLSYAESQGMSGMKRTVLLQRNHVGSIFSNFLSENAVFVVFEHKKLTAAVDK